MAQKKPDDVPSREVVPANPISRYLGSYRYVLVTAAKNERTYIERVMQAVVAQTLRPICWVVVSDASSDGTDEIVAEYARLYPWIQLHRINLGGDRHFGRKATCFNFGWRHVQELDFEIIANVDADISFDSAYVEFLLSKFKAEPRLGVAGTAYLEGSFVQYRQRWADIEQVCGQFQMFRRTCLEEIGGYLSMPLGGIDVAAVTTARMQGWLTQTFPERLFVHHRSMGAGRQTQLKARFIDGQKEYVLGNHPGWQMLRVVKWMLRKPYFFAGLFLMLGYISAYLQRLERPQGEAFVRFRREQQLRQVFNILNRKSQK